MALPHTRLSLGNLLPRSLTYLPDGDSISFPWCYDTFQVVENGPLRLTLQMFFSPADKGKYGRQVVEHRFVSLDRGSNFCQMKVWYSRLTTPADAYSLSVAQSHWQSARQNQIASLQNYWLAYYHLRRLTLYDYQRRQVIRLSYTQY